MLRRRLLMDVGVSDYVDLGLPSGLLWAKGNLINSVGSYAIGNETDWGTYISWGNIIGHNESEGYNFNDTNYDSTPGKEVSADIPSTDTQHDMCVARLGAPWHLPTKEDFKELYDNTDTEWVANYNNTGVEGRKFIKKTDHSVHVFFPASGYYKGTTLYNRGTSGHYWSASFISATSAYNLNFSSSSVNPKYNSFRRYGRSVRPVRAELRYIEYLESTGTQYIDTLINAASDIRLVVDAQFTSTSNAQVGTGNTALFNKAFAFGIYSSKWVFRCGGSSATNSGTANTERHTFSIESGTGKVDSTTYSVPTYSETTDGDHLWLFARNNNGTANQPASMKIYSAQIYKNNSLVANLIPVRKGEVGYMYDTVSNQLLANGGTGTFTLGPDI